MANKHSTHSATAMRQTQRNNVMDDGDDWLYCRAAATILPCIAGRQCLGHVCFARVKCFDIFQFFYFFLNESSFYWFLYENEQIFC